MRLTATDKAIGELHMRRADIARALDYIKETPSGVSTEDRIAGDLADIERCVDLLKTVSAPPKVAKVPRAARTPKAAKLKKSVEAES